MCGRVDTAAPGVADAIGGTTLADAMFAVPTVSLTRRGGGPVLLGEVVATAGLLRIATLARTG